MSNKPEKVELYVNNKLVITLNGSHKDSLDGKLSGKVDMVRIFGSEGAIVSFFDDQKFRTGENWVSIKKTTSTPIDVNIGKNFVGADQEKGERLYTGSGDGFEFAFSRKEKKNLLNKLEEKIKNTTGFDFDDILTFARTAGVPHTDKIDLVKDHIKISSNNYRVDNVSSVKFG